jgi:ribosomal protein L19E
MAAMDWAEERDAAVQFLQGMGAYISQVQPLVQQAPQAGPVLMKLLQWGLSKFRVSSEIESVIDQAVASMQQNMNQPEQPPGPTPAEMIEQAKLQLEAEKIQSNERIAAMESQTDKEIASLKASIDVAKMETQARMDAMQQNFQQIQQLMTSLPAYTQSQMLDMNELRDMVLQNKFDADEKLGSVLVAVNRRKKRIPIRDENGDILEVREVDDDEQETQSEPADPQSQMLERLGSVLTALNRRKKRTLVRDENGDILEVREVDDDEDETLPGAQAAMSGGVPNLPPAMAGVGPEIQT